eukprot:CAMPEP_0177310304 /NCGR_PEP_ID=MMETSP0368-20130122/9765_1 /TAXON_ID=447022 ORGANISM="Scrippsiella hangoei-like, Strain SHHI-4" /NCGR_SAMPLE_ID=MMETSP0368 /ASSEMBLY_ACC=CAM_ASM_000363 /LENGTH=102 /DNA_ID=CAMNT_0018769249 /DNA_START=276 /DNA_END=585 /DNA_ORIENTATION=-
MTSPEKSDCLIAQGRHTHRVRATVGASRLLQRCADYSGGATCSQQTASAQTVVGLRDHPSANCASAKLADAEEPSPIAMSRTPDVGASRRETRVTPEAYPND